MATKKKSSTKKSPRTPRKESINDYVKDASEFEKFLLSVLKMGFAHCREDDEFKAYLKAAFQEEDFEISDELEENLSRVRSFFEFPEYGYLGEYDLDHHLSNLTEAYANRMYKKQILDMAIILGGPMELYLKERGIPVEAPELYRLMIELEGKYPDLGSGYL